MVTTTHRPEYSMNLMTISIKSRIVDKTIDYSFFSLSFRCLLLGIFACLLCLRVCEMFVFSRFVCTSPFRSRIQLLYCCYLSSSNRANNRRKNRPEKNRMGKKWKSAGKYEITGRKKKIRETKREQIKKVIKQKPIAEHLAMFCLDAIYKGITFLAIRLLCVLANIFSPFFFP